MGEDSRYYGRKTEIDTLLQRKFPAWFMQWHAQKHLNIYRMNSIEALARVYMKNADYMGSRVHSTAYL